jgi:hypothetical protein
MTLIKTTSNRPVRSMAEMERKFSMKIRNSEDQEWKSDNVSNETENSIKIVSEESDPRTQTAKAEIKITFHKPINLRKLLKLKHN